MSGPDDPALEALQDFCSGKGSDVAVPASPCPVCGKPLDAASGPEGSSPSPGDLSVCVYCGEASIFTAELELRTLTDDDLRSIDAATRTQLRAMQDIIRSSRLRSNGQRGVS